MNNEHSKLIGTLVVTAIVLSALFGGSAALFLTADKAPTPFSAPIDQITLDMCSVDNCPMPTVGIVTAGPQASTRIIATTTGRAYLEISNISTSTAVGQALYCNTNDRPAVVGQGFVIFASSTRIFTNLMGSVQCRFASGSSSVTYVER